MGATYDDRLMPDRRAYSDAEIETAVDRLTDPERLETAQRIVAHSAPQLQRILNEALDAGEWFGSAHRQAVLEAAGAADPDERMARVRTLIADETRVSMLVGVAVGLELGHLLLDATTAQEDQT
jgi:hypothetical protein